MSKAKKAEPKSFFTQSLREWHKSHHRPMPWSGEKNPYLVWLSEVILQQTRVEQGWHYFEKFRLRFPTVAELAAASEDEVLKLWEGLGYYTRARNLHAAARHIASELDGNFPDSYLAIRSLKGVGDYTAAAVASFAFGLPHAVVDGNVLRVLSRYFGIETPVDSAAGKKAISELAQAVLDTKNPGESNQALMDFGAGVCKPSNPGCGFCPLQAHCEAFRQGRVRDFPFKNKKPARRTRFFNYLIFNANGRVLLRKRTGRDIWRNLFDFPVVETDRLLNKKEICQHLEVKGFIGEYFHKFEKGRGPYRQDLTHQTIVAQFWEFKTVGFTIPVEGEFLDVARADLKNYPFPKVLHQFFSDKRLPLELF